MPPKCSFFSLESEETGCGETSVKKGKYPFAIDFDFDSYFLWYLFVLQIASASGATSQGPGETF